MYSWSATLPQRALVSGYSVELDANVDSFQPSRGDPLTAPVFQYMGESMSFVFRMTQTQLDEFRTAWRDDLKQGALSFTGPDFEKGTSGPVKWKPVPGQKPRFGARGTQFYVTLNLRRKV